VNAQLPVLRLQATEQRNNPAASKGKQGLWRSKPKEAVAGGAVPTVEVLDKDGNRQGLCTAIVCWLMLRRDHKPDVPLQTGVAGWFWKCAQTADPWLCSMLQCGSSEAVHDVAAALNGSAAPNWPHH
jgi:hypothetical protein